MYIFFHFVPMETECSHYAILLFIPVLFFPLKKINLSSERAYGIYFKIKCWRHNAERKIMSFNVTVEVMSQLI